MDTDLAQVFVGVTEELVPDACHDTERYRNSGVECDHGRLRARLRPMLGLETERRGPVAICGHGSSRACAQVTTSSVSKPGLLGSEPRRC